MRTLLTELPSKAFKQPNPGPGKHAFQGGAGANAQHLTRYYVVASHRTIDADLVCSGSDLSRMFHSCGSNLGRARSFLDRCGG